MSQDVLPENKIPVIRVPAMPSDLNQGGTVFGGWIMSQVDIAGSIPAAQRAGGTIVTRAVDSFEFKRPVFAGDLVSCYADVIKSVEHRLRLELKYLHNICKKASSLQQPLQKLAWFMLQ